MTDVSFSYGEKVILDGFSIEMPEDRVIGISGASGCGKTTLLRLIAGLENAAGGFIEAPPPEKIAFLFQENRLIPRLDSAGQIRAVLPRGADVTPWLRLVGLENEEHSPVSSLSGGMQRRLALARCAAYGFDKELLILDEPFSGVDYERARAIMDGLRALRIQIIYSAHDTQLLAFADDVIHLSGPPLVYMK